MKRCKGLILIVFVICSVYHDLVAQEQIKLPEVVFSTPQSQQFEQYLQHRITECNGSADISIPLYEIEIRGMKIPVFLSYNSSGVKYKQYDGEVGAGWSLSVGGYRVTRTIYGRPDESYSSIYTNSEFEQNYTQQINEYQKEAYLASYTFYGSEYVNQPTHRDGGIDQFNYMLPSTNGHFIISNRNPYKASIVQENTDSVIFKVTNSKVENIKVIDSSGISYLFGQDSVGKRIYEYSYQAGESTLETAWPLTKITTPYKDSLIFTYVSYNRDLTSLDVFPSLSVTEGMITDSSDPIDTNADAQLSFGGDGQQMQYVKEIRHKEFSILFYRTNSSPVYPQGYRLNKIIINSNSGNQIRTIDLKYVEQSHQWHTMLKEVVIKDNINIDSFRYQLDYYDAPTDSPRKTYPDMWGYYKKNSTSSNTNLQLYLHEEFKTDEIYCRLYLFNQLQYVFGHPEVWVNRVEVDSVNPPNYFSLRKIIYPTGGYTEFEYESNMYKNYNGITLRGGGLRVAKIISKPDNSSMPIITKYKYGIEEDGVGFSNFFIEPEHFKSSSYNYYLDGTAGGGATQRYTKMLKYSMNPINIDLSKFSIYYPQVSVYSYDSAGNTYVGKTVFHYSAQSRSEMTEYHSTKINLPVLEENNENIPYAYSFDGRPLLICKEYYNNQYKIKEDSLYYINFSSNIHKGIMVFQKVFSNRYDPGNSKPYHLYSNVESCFSYSRYNINMGTPVLFCQKTKEFSVSDSILTEKRFEYNNKNQIKSLRELCSRGNIMTTNYIYPQDVSMSPYMQMLNRNIIGSPIETYKFYNSHEISRTKINYQNFNDTSFILPFSVETSFTGMSNLETDMVYDKYDEYGNLLQCTDKSGLVISYIWSYNHRYPIAEIKNTTYNQIVNNISPSVLLDIISSSNYPTDAMINALSASLKNEFFQAEVTTYTYKPLVGMTSKTDPRGVTTYYEYDSFGRLKATYIGEKDENGNETKKLVTGTYRYHYKE